MPNVRSAQPAPSLSPRLSTLQDGVRPPPHLAALDDREVWAEFSVPDAACAPGDARWISHVAVDGMYCATCSFTVEKVVAAVPGVKSVQVNAASRVARVEWSAAEALPSRWFSAAQAAGYAMVPVSGMRDSLARADERRRLLWRWLVAGFCMMQVMMYAFPAYVAEPGEITPEMVQLLRWASWVLTLPVLLFSATPFFASALRDLRQKQIGMDVPVALGIAVAFVASTASTFDPQTLWGGEVWFDSVTMFVFFLLSGRLLEQRLRHRTAGALEALTRKLPDSVARQCANGDFEQVGVHRLRAGDVVRILPGEAFPADGSVIEGQTTVDEALLTGESHPLARGPGERVVAASHNLGAVVLVRVEKTGSATRYASIVALMQSAAAQKPVMAQMVDRIAKPFLWTVVLASGAAAWWWWSSSPAHAVGVAIAVLIVTCPCALSLATPAATLATAGALARAGVLVRQLKALTALTAIDTVVFDKTGTLTSDALGVQVHATRPGVSPAWALQAAGALAAQSLHPVSRALVLAAARHPVQPPAVEDVREVAGQGVSGRVQTAGIEGRLSLGRAHFCQLEAQHNADASSQVHLADEAGWLATFELSETLRPDAEQAVRKLSDMGLQVHLLSGDTPKAVAGVAQRTGIASYRATQTPEDKLAFVAQLQQQGQRLAMVGDGINDAPVLAQADVSFTLGQAAPLAQSRADVVILGGQLMFVAKVLERAHVTRKIVLQNLVWAAGYNAVCVPLAVVGWMPAWLAGVGMAVSSLVVVLNASRLSARVAV